MYIHTLCTSTPCTFWKEGNSPFSCYQVTWSGAYDAIVKGAETWKVTASFLTPVNGNETWTFVWTDTWDLENGTFSFLEVAIANGYTNVHM